MTHSLTETHHDERLQPQLASSTTIRGTTRSPPPTAQGMSSGTHLGHRRGRSAELVAHPPGVAHPVRCSRACDLHKPHTRGPISDVANEQRRQGAFRGCGTRAEHIPVHSLRAGPAISEALAEVSVERIATKTRRRRIDVLLARYIRPAQVLQTPRAVTLGLELVVTTAGSSTLQHLSSESLGASRLPMHGLDRVTHATYILPNGRLNNLEM
jgi:hypothetical protein